MIPAAIFCTSKGSIFWTAFIFAALHCYGSALISPEGGLSQKTLLLPSLGARDGL